MGEFLGRFELLRKLAAGGMGEVYLARQQGPVGFEKFLVIKTLLPHLTEDQDFVNMFFDEARIAAMLSHPNIAQIYDLGEASGRYYIAMEYVHGQTLRAATAAAEAVPGSMTAGLKCRIVAGAAQALHYAHDARNSAGQHLALIHRDVSPHNILIAFSGEVKLVDFGIAKANNKLARTATGVIKGKYAYMSPEQAYGERLDRRSDVFALGIVFHELLSGRRLFRRETENETMRAVTEAEILPPSHSSKSVPRALDAIVMKALQRDPGARYETCGQFQADVEGVIQRQRLPATTSHVAALMRALFPKEAEPDALKKLSEAGLEEQAAIEITLTHRRTQEATPALEPMLDPTQLDVRLRSCAASDQIYGLFLNAVEAAVTKKLGVAAAANLRTVTLEPKAWMDSLRYPTREFLRLLWRGIELLTRPGGGIEQSFAIIGKEAFALLIGSPLGAPLLSLPEAAAPALLIRPLVQLIQPMVQPGARVVGEATRTSALLIFKGEAVPLQLYGGIITAAFSHFGVQLRSVSWEKTTPDRVELRLGW